MNQGRRRVRGEGGMKKGERDEGGMKKSSEATTEGMRKVSLLTKQ